MKHYNEILLKTPLLDVSRFSLNQRVRIFAKDESKCPTGSLKARAAAFTVWKIASDKPQPGSLDFFDYSPGVCNYGIALAFACREFGHRAHILVSDDIPKNCEAKLARDGVDIIKIAGISDWDGMKREAGRISKERKEWIWTNQYENPLNALAHYETTGKEIIRQMKERNVRPDYFLATVGTGSSITGISLRLKEEFRCKTICVQPSSPTPKIKGARKLEWPAENRKGNVPGVFASGKELVDSCIFIDPAKAKEMSETLASKDNVDISASAAMNLLAAAELSGQMKEGIILTLIPALSRKKEGVA